jgi:short-subunit dehydrogenase involved in D-alanine esterification of teichoic acids
VNKHVESSKLVAIFHNAGTIGNIELCSDQLNSSDDWHQYLQTNLISTIIINNAIYSKIKSRVESKSLEFLAVEITSLAAISPFISFTQVG